MTCAAPRLVTPARRMGRIPVDAASDGLRPHIAASTRRPSVRGSRVPRRRGVGRSSASGPEPLPKKDGRAAAAAASCRRGGAAGRFFPRAARAPPRGRRRERRSRGRPSRTSPSPARRRSGSGGAASSGARGHLSRSSRGAAASRCAKARRRPRSPRAGAAWAARASSPTRGGPPGRLPWPLVVRLDKKGQPLVSRRICSLFFLFIMEGRSVCACAVGVVASGALGVFGLARLGRSLDGVSLRGSDGVAWGDVWVVEERGLARAGKTRL